MATIAAPGSHFIHLRWPRDRERIVAMVDDLPLRLEDVVAHIDSRHYPGFREFLAGPDGKGSPDGARMLESDLIAPWVRQLADITALQAEAKAKGLDPAKGEEPQSAALKAGFESFLDSYLGDLQRRGVKDDEGHVLATRADLSQQRVDHLLADYQLRNGLACEMQGWLDFLEPPGDWTNQQLNDFFRANARVFGGGVTLAHILVQNRDAGTGIMLTDEARARAAARLSLIKARLLPDGSNFEDTARLYSEDTRTAPDGGKLENVERFDFRLPAAICRTAWAMKDGQLSDVVETQYGWHLLKRIEHVQKKFMLFTDAALPTVREVMRRHRQENLLFGARQRHKIELKF